MSPSRPEQADVASGFVDCFGVKVAAFFPRRNGSGVRGFMLLSASLRTDHVCEQMARRWRIIWLVSAQVVYGVRRHDVTGRTGGSVHVHPDDEVTAGGRCGGRPAANVRVDHPFPILETRPGHPIHFTHDVLGRQSGHFRDWPNSKTVPSRICLGYQMISKRLAESIWICKNGKKYYSLRSKL